MIDMPQNFFEFFDCFVVELDKSMSQLQTLATFLYLFVCIIDVT